MHPDKRVASKAHCLGKPRMQVCEFLGRRHQNQSLFRPVTRRRFTKAVLKCIGTFSVCESGHLVGSGLENCLTLGPDNVSKSD